MGDSGKKLSDYLYYQDDWATIYCGDCLEIIKELEPIDLMVTDPPYGIGLETAYRLRGRGRLAKCRNYPPIYGDDNPFNPYPFLKFSKYLIFWGGNYYADKLPPSSGWLIWDKRVLNIQNDQADCELAWTNFVKGTRIFRHMWSGFLKDSERGEGYHPAQKPTALMSWCLTLKWTPRGTIIDPFMGSGTTCVAAKNLNRKSIGIEINPVYCEIAVKRLRQEVFDFG